MIPRLYLPDDLREGALIAVALGQAHHLANVLRREIGDELLVFNGRDGEFSGRIASRAKREIAIRLDARVREQTQSPDLWLCFAPLKKNAIDFLIEKGTELGATRFQPVTTARTNTDRVNIDRLRQNAIEAAEQCELLAVPEMAPIVPLDRLIGEWPRDRRLLCCAEQGPAAPIADVLAGFTRVVSPPHGWAILCGPEGGFEEAELDRLANLPFVSLVGLGPRILRADTAALMALAVFQSILGDGRARPPDRSARDDGKHGRKTRCRRHQNPAAS